MKKVFLLLFAVSFMFSQNINAQNDLLNKALEKEYKSKLKEFKKEGWKVFGSSRTMEVLLLKHFDWLNNRDDVYEIVGVASAFKSKNIGKQMAMNNACVTYASQMGAVLKGRAISDMKADASNLSSEFDQFYAVFERSIEQEIRGELKESFSLIKDNGNGSYEMQTFFLVNEEAALDARRRALKNATKEAITSQKYADIFSKYVNEKIYPTEFSAEDAGRNL